MQRQPLAADCRPNAQVAGVNEGSGPHRFPTIREIVEQAGVATSTVRRGLFAPCNANARTPERIERILSELGYVPRAQGPNLSSGRSGLFRHSCLTSQTRSTLGSCAVPITSSRLPDTRSCLWTRRRLRTWSSTPWRGCAARLMESSRGLPLTDEHLTEAAKHQPKVSINRPAADAPTVLLDTPGIMVQAVKHLASLAQGTPRGP
jgi:LacI family transcriptional regulator, repressor for deo operon, udp, cdd, tsx, nupC, and nupG